MTAAALSGAVDVVVTCGADVARGGGGDGGAESSSGE